MTLLQTTLADTQARQNLARNLEALARTQPRLRPALSDPVADIEWVFARDRALTALDKNGRWLAGCSVPRLAAAGVLKKLEIKSAVGCFLAPSHAAQLRAALGVLRPEQAVIAVVPETQDLRTMLHCDDFAAEIAAHRLWFITGESWETELRTLLEEQVGLATPGSFIRTPDAAAELIDSMIPAAQRVFAEVNAARNKVVRELARPLPVNGNRRVCVVAPGRFRLWNDLGQTMLEAFEGHGDVEAVHFDADDPACSSPLALLQSASACGAIFTANTGRTDLPGVIPETIPWVTWVTGGRVPSPALAGAEDRLVVVDPVVRDAACRSGWNEQRVHLGGWRRAQTHETHGRAAGVLGDSVLTIIADTMDLETPKDLLEYSSHSILWEAIRQELLGDPFRLNDPNEYLAARMRQLGVAEAGFPRARFIERLIVPAYQQGLARVLKQAAVPLRIHGDGWSLLEDFQTLASGPVHSREQFGQILSTSTSIVHVWPTTWAHPIDTCGLPVVRAAGFGRERFLRDARLAVNGKLPASGPQIPPLSIDPILMVLGGDVR